MKKMMIFVLALLLFGCNVDKKVSYVFNVEDQERIKLTYKFNDHEQVDVYDSMMFVNKDDYQVKVLFIHDHQGENNAQTFYDEYHKQSAFKQGLLNNQKYYYYEDQQDSVLFIEIANSSYHIVLISESNQEKIFEIGKQLTITKE